MPDDSGIEQKDRLRICKGCGIASSSAQHHTTCVRAVLLDTLTDFLQDLTLTDFLQDLECVISPRAKESLIRLKWSLTDLDIINTEAQRELDNA